MRPRARAAAGLVLAVAAVGCGSPPAALDLLGVGNELVEAAVNGRDRAWVMGQMGKQVRVDDHVRRTLPASPPSRLRFRLDVAKGSHLVFGHGIAADRHDRPGVEFVVKVSRGGREQTVWSSLLDPVNRPAHRRWAEADVDLSAHAGKGVDLVLETRGFEKDDDPRRAFWATPALLPGPPPREGAASAAPNDAPLVVVYLVDTLRADHTTPYGYSRNTTPRLQAFAKDAVVFETAVAHASWTKPSVASLLTSQLPGRHRAVQLRDALDAGHVTLAEILQGRGFATGAAIANSVIYSQGVNFEQGFDHFVGLHGAGNRPSKLVEAAGVVDAALRFLDGRRGMPTFLYAHTMDPHVPYAPPPPFDRMFEPHPTPDHPAVDPRTDYKEPLDRERMIAQYDGDIAYGDQELGRLLDGLKARGLYDRALFVFLADHGEEFQDHGEWLHGKSVFDELVRIPLLVKFPGRAQAGRRVAQQVQEVDVLPTVLQALGLPLPHGAFAGRPLQEVLEGAAAERPAISEISHRGFVAHGMRTSADKYVRRLSPQEDELYFDLRADPGEKTNRIESARARADLLRSGVEAAMVPNPFRYALRAVGEGELALKLRTGGWIEAVQAQGLGPSERHELEANGRKLSLVLRPRRGQPREVVFGVRPMGAPVWVEGTRNGRPLSAADVALGQAGDRPAAVPFELPELEPHGEDEMKPTRNLTAPPPGDRPGLHVWLVMGHDRQLWEVTDDVREQLQALGYLGGH